MTILNIETSTTCCSAAITIDGKPVASVEQLANANHASQLPVFIQQLLHEANVNGWHLDAVALSQGPGSYTGLRIGASTAKGICYGLHIPLIPVDTLQVLCASVPSGVLPDNALLCPMLDARRMEVYTALYQQQGTQLSTISEVQAMIINADAFAQTLAQQPVYFFGNGAAKCQSVITHPNAHFVDNVVPQAQCMGLLAEMQPNSLDVKQMAYYEPFYLKEFVAAPSHIKGLK
ncbi:MAG: tRNA (adenosine(37)-N6)-threonylcarbamoyltransferase complex dimerization subunit type 1 TsaB [Paludibacteraceae bacterium]|nr:tRNA (adenosine(37)-N6)-threonylcarbamoyltransferase complex dimerization subunit type 1 TsaB [Paludibacteraceae bacterium]